MPLEKLSVRQTPTGYWVITSGEIELSGAITRAAAEAECDVLRRIRERASEEAPHPSPRPAR
jgi:hypothetical protein